MSIDSLRNDIARQIRDQADMDRRAGQLRTEAARLHEEAVRLQRDASRSSSISSASGALQRAAQKSRDAGEKEQKVGELMKKAADIAARRARAEAQLSSELERQRRRDADEAKRQHAQQLRDARAVTDEIRRQADLQREIGASRRAFERELPEKITALFLGANPMETSRLRLDAEVRAITEKIRLSEFRDAVELVSRWAVRTTDLLQHLNEHKPTIVHFSGHGGEDGTICFEGAAGEAKGVTADAIAATLATACDDLRVVIFNACFSALQAEAAIRHVPAAIGMEDSIDDAAAALFSSQFYSAIGFGRSVQVAFDQARAALLVEGLEDANIVRLFLRDVGAGDLVLVKP